MSADETTRLRALLERATQTPWRQDGAEIMMGDSWTVIAECTLPDCLEVADEDREEQEERNAALIVAAVNALPGLLDAAERAERAERERDDLAATLETRTAEHALAMERIAAVTAERDALTALRPRDPHRTGHRCACCGREGAPGADDVCPWCSDGMATQRERDVARAQQAPLVACVDALRAAATAAGWRDADATGEHLVAWVRRGGAPGAAT